MNLGHFQGFHGYSAKQWLLLLLFFFLPKRLFLVDLKPGRCKKNSKHNRILHAYLYWHTHCYICKSRVSWLYHVRLLNFSHYIQFYCSSFRWCLCIWCDRVSMAAQNNVYFSFYFCKCILTCFIFFCFKIVLFALWIHACKMEICCFSVAYRSLYTFIRLVFKCINANQDLLCSVHRGI